MRLAAVIGCMCVAACSEPKPTGEVVQAAHRADLSTPLDMSMGVDFGDPSAAGVFSCWQPTPCAQTCTAPQYCCFFNSQFYGVQGEEGFCSNTPCVQSGSQFGSQTCDGPEDCPSGQLCCSVEVIDPDNGIQSNTIACQAGPCTATAPSIAHELCHPNGAPCSISGQSCIIANGPSSSTNGCPAGQGEQSAGDIDMPFNIHVCH